MADNRSKDFDGISRRMLLGGLGATAAVAGCAEIAPPDLTMPGVPASRGRETEPGYMDRLADLGVEWEPPIYGKGILVNIPSFDLVAFQDGKPVMVSRVVVGERISQTPVKDVGTSVVRFRPTWRPTKAMIERHGYEDKVTPPGPKNPLGLATIRFDDGSPVYLHGTPSKRQFERKNRARSNGCVRVEKLKELVGWVLDWEEDEVKSAMYGRRTYDEDVWGYPIHLGYYTTWRMPGGAVTEHRDVYRRGRRG